MTGRRQPWPGLTRSALSFALALGLASGLIVSLAQPSGAAAGLGAATLVATALLVALHTVRPAVIALVPGQARPLDRTVGTLPPVLVRSVHPDAPGRSRPRAPGSGSLPRARP